MSAARAEVSTVVISNEPTNAPVKDFAIITSSLWPALRCPALAWAARPIRPRAETRLSLWPTDRSLLSAAPGRRAEAYAGQIWCPLQAEHVEHRSRGRVPELGQI